MSPVATPPMPRQPSNVGRGGRQHAIPAARKVVASFVSLVAAACIGNAPPMFHTRAQAFLERQGVAPPLIAKLIDERALTEDEARSLSRYRDAPTLHLVAANAGTPADVVERLARHADEEIRWGAATNPKLSVATLLRLRTRGEYSVMNGYLARNPALPADVIREMYRSKEAPAASVAMNPSCPPDVVEDILTRQPDDVRAWLAWNRGIGPDTLARLDRDPSEGVARMLRANPSYRKWKGAQGPSEAPAPKH